jgi:Ser/Thr protein kinase RdoA (MazF antagonist)
MEPDLERIVKNFRFEGHILGIDRHWSGHINDTHTVHSQGAGDRVHRYVLQRINHYVFKKPEKLMENVEAVTAHLRRKIIAAGGDPERETLNLIPTLEGRSFHKTPGGDYWRAYLLIEGARTYEVAVSLDHVYSASNAFGRFQRMLSDFPPYQLHETIPDFHHTRKRFDAFVEAVERDAKNRARAVATEIAFAEERAGETSLLVDMLERGELPERVTHNDTKFNNVMIDDETGEGICVIDLDTVMPGLSLYDFGDSVRSGANSGEEDERDLSKVWLDLETFDHLAHGYLDAARDFLTPAEVALLPFSAKLMTFECGIRFLADHLDGDVYFRIHRENQNLDRCRTQFKLVADMEKNLDRMVEIVETYR